MDNTKLVHQLFIGKVADVIGSEKTETLLKEAKEAFDTPVVVGQSEQLKAEQEAYNAGYNKGAHEGYRNTK